MGEVIPFRRVEKGKPGERPPPPMVIQKFEDREAVRREIRENAWFPNTLGYHCRTCRQLATVEPPGPGSHNRFGCHTCGVASIILDAYFEK